MESIDPVTEQKVHKAERSSGISLRKLPVGQWARLCEFSSRPASRRLLDLGFVPGTRLKIVRRAPLGDPVEIEIRGTRLCLRRSQLRGLRVVPEEERAS